MKDKRNNNEFIIHRLCFPSTEHLLLSVPCPFSLCPCSFFGFFWYFLSQWFFRVQTNCHLSLGLFPLPPANTYTHIFRENRNNFFFFYCESKQNVIKKVNLLPKIYIMSSQAKQKWHLDCLLFWIICTTELLHLCR